MKINEGTAFRSHTSSMNLGVLDSFRMAYDLRELLRSGRVVKWNRTLHGPLTAVSAAFLAERKNHALKRIVINYKEVNRALLPV